MCAQLEQDKEIELLRFTRENSDKDLEDYVDRADFIYHIAGVNRPKDETEFDTGNRDLTQNILKLLSTANKSTPLLLTSSTQGELDNPYGKSKKAAEQAVFDWAKSSGAKAYVYRLPNVFGKWCRPNYNSVVATFCHNIANNIDISINDPNKELNLVYIDDVIAEFAKALTADVTVGDDGFCYIPRIFKLTLSALADKLYRFKESRATLLLPSLEEPIDRFLYATFISYLDKNDFGYELTTKSDERGWLAEFIKSRQFGQIFVSQTKPGYTRGIHWHHTKIEKFLVIEGEGTIKLRDYFSDKVIDYKVSGSTLRVVEMPAGYIHSIKNTGKTDLLLLIWASEVFDPEHPDTYYQEV